MSDRAAVVLIPSPSGRLVWPWLGTSCLYFLAFKMLESGGIFAPFPYPFGLCLLLAGAVCGAKHVAERRRFTVVADAEGVRVPGERLDIRYERISELRFDIVDGKSGRSRVVTVEEQGGRVLRFGALSSGALVEDGIRNLPHAPVLLSLIVARTRSEPLYPDSWRAGAVGAGPAPASGRERGWLRRGFTGAWSLAAAGVKLLPKIGAALLALLKAVKPGAALLSLGLYGWLVSWKFACALLTLVFLHECGHAFAMRRCGLKVRGIYFIPFFGGVAVGEGHAATRLENAYIALNGPVWGTALAVLCLAAYGLTGGRRPELAALAAWGALINAFNLLPIVPLDGGRLLEHISRSWDAKLAARAVGASLMLGGALSYLAGLELLVLMVLLGAWEFSRRLDTAWMGPAAELLGPGKPLSHAEWEHFCARVAPVLPGRTSAALVAARRLEFESLRKELGQTPMSAREALAMLGLYAALAAVLAALLYFVRGIPGAGDPVALLR